MQKHLKIIFIQSYPIYHDHIDTSQWLRLEHRDKWMPAIAAEMGHEVEIWAVSTYDLESTYRWNEDTIVTIRLFKADHTPPKSKHHYSTAMVKHALEHPADYYIIKGLDGGAGIFMIDQFLKKSGKPFAFIIGGKCQSHYLHLAHTVFYESDRQIPQIMEPYWTLRGRKRCEAHLIKLPKSVDLDHFSPMSAIDKTFDLVSVGRLIPYYKRYEDLFTLSEYLNVSFVGGGPLLEQNKRIWPDVHWYGTIQNAHVPMMLNTARAFFYPSKRDFFPRVIAEAASCGLPILCFEDSISEDVVPEHIGLRLRSKNYEDSLLSLIQDADKLTEMGIEARSYALAHFGKDSTRVALEKFVSRLV